MMAWFDSRPTAAFADKGGERTAALASAVSELGIVVAKAGMALSLHLGVPEHEAHHVRSLPDVSSSRIDGPPVAAAAPPGGGRRQEAVVFRLRTSFAVPLCSGPEPCLLYGHASELPDFVVGLVGGRVPDGVVAKRHRALAKRAAAMRRRGRGGSPAAAAAADDAASLARLAASKLGRGPFFLCRIFASCPGGMDALASSLNFTRAQSGPNALVAGAPRPVREGPGGPGAQRGQGGCHPLAAGPPGRLPRLLGRDTAPVLSPAEMASILALPPSMFGLQMAAGADRTFTNVRTDAPDPAAPFERMGEWGA